MFTIYFPQSICPRALGAMLKIKTTITYSMRTSFLTLLFVFLLFNLQAQTKVRLPGVYFSMFRYYPHSNDKITFSTLYPFSDYQNQQVDPKISSQYLMSIPVVSDSLLSECIKYTMLSLSFDLAFKNKPYGTEIWYGTLSNNFNVDPTMTGIYYKNIVDSTLVYILTTYSLTYLEKKKKSNTSQYIGESIKLILSKIEKRNKF